MAFGPQHRHESRLAHETGPPPVVTLATSPVMCPSRATPVALSAAESVSTWATMTTARSTPRCGFVQPRVPQQRLKVFLRLMSPPDPDDDRPVRYEKAVECLDVPAPME